MFVKGCIFWEIVFIYVFNLTIAGELASENYDLIVIGGGSGGLAAAKEAYSKYKKTVLVIDYVKPSEKGTTWGEGGTCVNVGCIPKKLMHEVALVGEIIEHANNYGWEFSPPKTKTKTKNQKQITLNWSKMIAAVQNPIMSTRFVLQTNLVVDSEKTRKVTKYYNGRGEFVNENTVKVTLWNRTAKALSKEEKIVTGTHIIIAVGGRPTYPDIPGVSKLVITSDDLFSLKDPPGKTLIIGAGYIGLECAGFLSAMGMDVTVMVRSVVLREMDQQMAGLVRESLQQRGIKFLDKATLVSITEEKTLFKHKRFFKRLFGKKEYKRQLHVKWATKTENGDVVSQDVWDTVLVATGRKAATADLKLENAKVNVREDGKIDAPQEKTNMRNIFAVGDVLYGRPELTPVAMQAGKLLVHRLYGKSQLQMDYDNVPTTVFTPQEYSFVGMSEEKAIKVRGEDKIEVYHTMFTPYEYLIAGKPKSSCYLKVICEREGDQKILGMHYFGPSAGEVMQGYAVAMKTGVTFKQLTETIGIHPTSSEDFIRLTITKRSGISPKPQSCCS